MDKLDRSSSASASTDDEVLERQSVSDPMEELDAFGCSQPDQQADMGSDDVAVFLRAVEDL